MSLTEKFLERTNTISYIAAVSVTREKVFFNTLTCLFNVSKIILRHRQKGKIS
jgi:hypothetical protein